MLFTSYCVMLFLILFFFFFQAEDGIRDAQESRGLGDVYKRQLLLSYLLHSYNNINSMEVGIPKGTRDFLPIEVARLSLIHI